MIIDHLIPDGQELSLDDAIKRIAMSYRRMIFDRIRGDNVARSRHGRVHYRFWQRGGGYDRNIVEPSTVYLQIEYIHNNPVRRGLCELDTEWRWSSAADHAGIGKGPLRLDLESLPTVIGS